MYDDIIKHKTDTWNVINYILYKLNKKYSLSGLDLETSLFPILVPIPTTSHK